MTVRAHSRRSRTQILGESVQYVAADLAEIEAVLQYREEAVDAAIDVLVHDLSDVLARQAIRGMQDGDMLVWDGHDLRAGSWETFSELSAFLANVYRLFGRQLGFDAWPDGLRIQYLLADWNPLPKEFGRKICCRPTPPVAFESMPEHISESCVPYLESYPHGFLARDELPQAIEGLHRIIDQLYCRLTMRDRSPFDNVPPGSAFPRSAMPSVMNLADDGLETWQLQRAVVLYNACCGARAIDKDLVAVGY